MPVAIKLWGESRSEYDVQSCFAGSNGLNPATAVMISRPPDAKFYPRRQLCLYLYIHLSLHRVRRRNSAPTSNVIFSDFNIHNYNQYTLNKKPMPYKYPGYD